MKAWIYASIMMTVTKETVDTDEGVGVLIVVEILAMVMEIVIWKRDYDMKIWKKKEKTVLVMLMVV